MLDRLRVTAHAYEAMNHEVVPTAIDELDTKFEGRLADNGSAKKVHETITRPLHGRLLGGEEPKLFWKNERPGKNNPDDYAIQVGDLVFPVRVEQGKYGRVTLTLYAPKKPSRKLENSLERDGIKGIYDEKIGKVPKFRLVRGASDATDLKVAKSEFKSESYGWALFEVASHMLRSITPKKKVMERKFDHVLETDEWVEAPKDKETQLLDTLLGISDVKKVPFTDGPPVADDLLFAGTWKDRAVAVTSMRGTDDPVRVWVQLRHEGESYWQEVSFDEDINAPSRGVGVALGGAVLKLVGGVDADGKTMKSYLEYDLERGMRHDFAPDQWKAKPRLDKPIALPVVAVEDGDTFIAGGVAGFFVDGKAKEERTPKPQGLRRLLVDNGRGDLKMRADIPAECTGSTTVARHGVVFIGPGNARDGKVFAHSTKRGQWVPLPELPAEVGQGQMMMSQRSERLIYAGGYKADGSPSKTIYELDLTALNAKWKKIGESPFVAGSARIVRSHGSVLSLMVREASAAETANSFAFHLDLGGK